MTVGLPETLYLRLQRTAQATRQTLADVLLRVVQVGSPPGWEDAPAEFQADLAVLDRLDDDTLWKIARSRQTDSDMVRYQALLDTNAADALTPAERAAALNMNNPVIVTARQRWASAGWHPPQG